ncbi:NAD-dependent epimerase/dehydratase family protein [Xanthobacter dioxanivorans]|uniref:NAD-dependent epimerase/dehydratase family protein n=1 Tax=Xanthobacter dioxanivorans TaxID=2528964 RepID=A0A974PLU6_9HYPH|nr:NAD-dependent epimerase/dehydratase family protein [Xanthobacter dioxanivorans]QRG05970.1 NAD-dependent epimerase/dehydratase family protein [Xanthobacter dioxanivorans]
MTRNIRHAVVIGSSGFLGSWLVDRLVREGTQVTGISRRKGPVLDSLAEPSTWTSADIVNAPPDTYLPECDTVFFLAGIASVPASLKDPVADLDGNLRSALRILQTLRERDTGTSFIFASSAAVYGSALVLPMAESHPLQPLSPYGVSKLAAEAYVRLYATTFGIPGASARVFSVYGPGQHKQVVYDWALKVATNTPQLSFFGAPEVSRDFIYVSDATAAFAQIAKNAPLKGEAYNVASGTETTLEGLARNLLAISGASARFSFSGDVRVGDPVRWQSDIAALQRLGFQTEVSLLEGLRRTYLWATGKSFI